MMKSFKYIVCCILLALSIVPSGTFAQETGKAKDKIDVRGIIFGHILDSYEWHITNFGDTKVSIPLPVIVYSQSSGWNSFLSSKIEEGASYKGFFISKNGKYKDKIVEKDASGKEVRPFDISLTKVSLSIILYCILLAAIILGVAKWYKRKEVSDAAPRGFVGFMEMFIMMINDDVIKSCVGKDYKRFAPYLLTVFFFIFLSNLMGQIPIFPGGANVTGNIAITFFLALCTFLAINLFGNKEYWKDVFWPDVPLWLKCPVPMMPVIEFFGVFTKPFALMVRLFANIMAGHAVALSMICIIFVTAKMGPLMNGTLSVVSVLFAIFMGFIEVLVAFIQAYVFTMLSSVFIGLSRMEKEKEK